MPAPHLRPVHSKHSCCLAVRRGACNLLAPVDLAATRQRSWDDPCCQRQSTLLLNAAVNDREKARLRTSLTATSGAWLRSRCRYHRSACGWTTTSSGWLWVCTSRRQSVRATHVHVQCPCGCPWHARVACKRSAGRHPRHGLLNDVVWRAMLRAQVPSCKEPARLSRSDRKRPDGVLLIPWSRGRCVTWDVTSPDTLAPSHLPSSATQAGSAGCSSRSC